MSRHQPVSPFERAAFHRRGSAGLDIGGLNLQAIVPMAAPTAQAAPSPALNVNVSETFQPGFEPRYVERRYQLSIYDLPPNMLFTAGGGTLAVYSGPAPYPDAILHPVGRTKDGQPVFMSPSGTPAGTVSLLASETQGSTVRSVREDEVRAF